MLRCRAPRPLNVAAHTRTRTQQRQERQAAITETISKYMKKLADRTKHHMG